jgi:ribokinase
MLTKTATRSPRMLTVFGSINLDLIFTLPALPRPGQTLLASGLSLEPGGKGANQAVAAALDGAKVQLVGAVGNDAFAESALVGLKRAGVNIQHLARTTQPTGCAAISSAHGENHIVVAPGANLEARAAQVQDADLGRGALVLLQMETPPAETSALIRRARSLGARTVLNLAPAGALDIEVLRLVDILVVNDDESAWLAGHLGVAPDAAPLADATTGVVIRTLGAAGAEVATPEGQTWREPAPRIEVTDTTAAGDCFVGVLAAALDAGRALPAAVARAVAAASLCCTRAGSQGSLPGRSEIDACCAWTVG